MGKELERWKISLGKLFMRIRIHVLRLITKESSQFSSLSGKKPKTITHQILINITSLQ
jgi:hypothetical protein